jgi:hypothetical protein
MEDDRFEEAVKAAFGTRLPRSRHNLSRPIIN